MCESIRDRKYFVSGFACHVESYQQTEMSYGYSAEDDVGLYQATRSTIPQAPLTEDRRRRRHYINFYLAQPPVNNATAFYSPSVSSSYFAGRSVL